MKLPYPIAVGGENLIEYTRRSDGDVAILGGSGFNIARALGRQGADVTYLTPISTDDWGEKLHARLVEAGVKIGADRRPEPTTMSVFDRTTSAVSYSLHRAGTAERMVSRADLTAGMIIAEGAILHIGSLALAADPDAAIWYNFCQKLHSNRWVMSIDPNVQIQHADDPYLYRARLENLLQSATLVKTSEEDLAGLFPEMSFQDAMDHLVDTAQARVIIVTCEGACGQAFLDGTPQPFETILAKADVAGKTAAADAFMATLLATVTASGQHPEECLKRMTAQDLAEMLKRADIAAALTSGNKEHEPPNSAEIDTALAIGRATNR